MKIKDIGSKFSGLKNKIGRPDLSSLKEKVRSKSKKKKGTQKGADVKDILAKITYRLPKRKVIQDVSDLEGVENKKKYIVGAGYVLATTNFNISPGFQYEFLKRSTPALIPYKTKKLYFWINKKVLEKQEEKNASFTLLHDYYIKFGLFQKGRSIVIGGNQTTGATNLICAVFKNGKMESITDYSLPPSSSTRFSYELENKLKEIAKIPHDKLFWCYPLPVRESGIKEILGKFEAKIVGSIILSIPSFSKVERQKRSALYKLAVVSIIAGGIAFAAPTWYAWSGYKSSLQDWEKEIDGFRDLYSTGENRLDALERQRFFLENREEQTGASGVLEKVMIAINDLDGAKVNLIDFNFPESSGEEQQKADIDYRVRIELPESRTDDPMGKAKEIMNDMVEIVGGDMYLERYRDLGAGYRYELSGVTSIQEAETS